MMVMYVLVIEAIHHEQIRPTCLKLFNALRLSFEHHNPDVRRLVGEAIDSLLQMLSESLDRDCEADMEIVKQLHQHAVNVLNQGRQHDVAATQGLKRENFVALGVLAAFPYYETQVSIRLASRSVQLFKESVVNKSGASDTAAVAVTELFPGDRPDLAMAVVNAVAALTAAKDGESFIFKRPLPFKY